MDTLIVFCALIFAAATLSFISMCITSVFGLVTGQSRRQSKQHTASRVVDPFEPADTHNMHLDPRMIQRTPRKAAANINLPVPGTAVAVARPQGRVVPRRPVLPSGRLTQRPVQLLAS